MPKIHSHTVNVTREIIDEATPLNSARCMIAQAVRHFGGTSTNVTAESVAFNLDGARYVYPLPAKAVVQLIKFDNKAGKAIRPFKFQLSANTGLMKEIQEREPHGAHKKKTRKSKGKRDTVRTVRRFHGLRVIEVRA
jgi:hypothetical protein